MVVGSSPAGAVRSRAATRACGCAAASATEATVASRGEQGRAGVKAVRRAGFFRWARSVGVSGGGRLGETCEKLPGRPRWWVCHGGGHWHALLSNRGQVFFRRGRTSATRSGPTRTMRALRAGRTCSTRSGGTSSTPTTSQHPLLAAIGGPPTHYLPRLLQILDQVVKKIPGFSHEVNYFLRRETETGTFDEATTLGDIDRQPGDAKNPAQRSQGRGPVPFYPSHSREVSFLQCAPRPALSSLRSLFGFGTYSQQCEEICGAA